MENERNSTDWATENRERILNTYYESGKNKIATAKSIGKSEYTVEKGLYVCGFPEEICPSNRRVFTEQGIEVMPLNKSCPICGKSGFVSASQLGGHINHCKKNNGNGHKEDSIQDPITRMQNNGGNMELGKRLKNLAYANENAELAESRKEEAARWKAKYEETLGELIKTKEKLAQIQELLARPEH